MHCSYHLCSVRPGERRNDGGAVPAIKQTSRPSDRVRRDRFSPPANRHMTGTTSQAEWKPPPTGDRSRTSHHDAKGDCSLHCMAAADSLQCLLL